MSITSFIQNNDQLKNQDEIIIFAGSFNPWHEGHSSCINLMPEEKVIIVAPDHNPFKELTPSLQKQSTLHDIQEELDKLHNKTYLYDGFYKANVKNPTINWLLQFKEKFPNKKISLLMGHDTFISIDKWIRADELLKLLDEIYIASRLDNLELRKRQVSILKELNPKLKMTFIGNHPFEELSSSALREK